MKEERKVENSPCSKRDQKKKEENSSRVKNSLLYL